MIFFLFLVPVAAGGFSLLATFFSFLFFSFLSCSFLFFSFSSKSQFSLLNRAVAPRCFVQLGDS